MASLDFVMVIGLGMTIGGFGRLIGAGGGFLLVPIVGILSIVAGIGGGIVHVPFLIVVLGLPVHVATATLRSVLSISTLVGTVTFVALGHADVRLAALRRTGVLVGAQIGARASVRASARVIRRVLAGSLALVGLRMVLEAARHLHR